MAAREVTAPQLRVCTFGGVPAVAGSTGVGSGCVYGGEVTVAGFVDVGQDATTVTRPTAPFGTRSRSTGRGTSNVTSVTDRLGVAPGVAVAQLMSYWVEYGPQLTPPNFTLMPSRTPPTVGKMAPMVDDRVTVRFVTGAWSYTVATGGFSGVPKVGPWLVGTMLVSPRRVDGRRPDTGRRTFPTRLTRSGCGYTHS